jgi:nitrogen fixation/metabolism regulation signal transduction histidine kinase
VKQLHARNAAYDQILKKNEQMYALLALVVGLCPAVQNTLDEHVLVALKDKFGEKLQVKLVIVLSTVLPCVTLCVLALVVGLCLVVQNTLDELVLVALKDKFGKKLQVKLDKM